MLQDATESTPTISSVPSSDVTHEFNQSSVTKCLKLVNDFKKGIIEKGDALLEIQSILQAAISESNILTQVDFKPSFTHYLQLLDHVANENEVKDGRERVNREEPPRREEQDQEGDSLAKEKDLQA
ncbi:hypothetical protein CY34DRAFT_14696 [Suillus luteus UH-Slu-Lm8-n1]|uniref:Uncharacterized protein n=1 Tax=Suillus luteus UH-Slu-Lm8-n1 TaxID=930992 RepID=A0A0D0AX67_9AGAM|nr:hypothetical protein CY34DRAFT_14696 [Suillus luteus UH-Slu-Lm8-n1]